MRRPAVFAIVLLLAVAAGCGGGGGEPARVTAGPQKKEADRFVNDLLNGRPDQAAELLSTQHSGLEFELPGVSIALQERRYRVARSKRRNRTTFAYELVGRYRGKPARAVYDVGFELDLDDWRVKGFTRVKKY